MEAGAVLGRQAQVCPSPPVGTAATVSVSPLCLSVLAFSARVPPLRQVMECFGSC